MEFDMKIKNNYILFSKNGKVYIADTSEKDKETKESIIYNIKQIESENTLNQYIDTIKVRTDKSFNLNNVMPTSAGIILTDLCQLRCNYCSYDSGKNTDSLNIEQVKLFIDYIFRNNIIRKLTGVPKQNNSHIYFAGGGEPTFNWDLFVDAVTYIKRMNESTNQNIKIYMTSNGILNDSQLKFIIENVDSVMISFDGNEFLQNKNRKNFKGENSFAIVHNSLNTMNKYKYNFSIRTTIWPKDLESLKSAADHIFLNYPNISKWEFEVVSELGRAEKSLTFDESNENNMLTCDLTKYFEELYNHMEKFYPNKIFSTSPIRFNPINFICGTIYGNFPWLRANGEIVTCIDAHENATILGNVDNKVNLFDFNDDFADKYIEKAKLSCENCIANYYCGYGCPVKNSEDNVGSKWLCKTKIEFYNKAFEEIIKKQKYLRFNGTKVNIDNLENVNIYEISTK